MTISTVSPYRRCTSAATAFNSAATAPSRRWKCQEWPCPASRSPNLLRQGSCLFVQSFSDLGECCRGEGGAYGQASDEDHFEGSFPVPQQIHRLVQSMAGRRGPVVAPPTGTRLPPCQWGGDDDPWAVVDGHGAVRGLSGLPVVDASIIPVVPSVAINLTTIMLAERIAETVHRRAAARTH